MHDSTCSVSATTPVLAAKTPCLLCSHPAQVSGLEGLPREASDWCPNSAAQFLQASAAGTAGVLTQAEHACGSGGQDVCLSNESGNSGRDSRGG